MCVLYRPLIVLKTLFGAIKYTTAKSLITSLYSRHSNPSWTSWAATPMLRTKRVLSTCIECEVAHYTSAILDLQLVTFTIHFLVSSCSTLDLHIQEELCETILLLVHKNWVNLKGCESSSTPSKEFFWRTVVTVHYFVSSIVATCFSIQKI